MADKKIIMQDPLSGDRLFPATIADTVYMSDGITPITQELESLKTSVSEGKSLIAAAVTDKGVSTAANDTFQTMAENIKKIPSIGDIKFIGSVTKSSWNGNLVNVGTAFTTDNTPKISLSLDKYGEGIYIISTTDAYLNNGEGLLPTLFNTAGVQIGTFVNNTTENTEGYGVYMYTGSSSRGASGLIIFEYKDNNIISPITNRTIASNVGNTIVINSRINDQYNVFDTIIGFFIKK